MVVDHLLLRQRHSLVGVLVHDPDEPRGVERGLHMIFGHLIDSEQHDRSPREGHRIGYTFFDDVAHLGGDAAQHGATIVLERHVVDLQQCLAEAVGSDCHYFRSSVSAA